LEKNKIHFIIGEKKKSIGRINTYTFRDLSAKECQIDQIISKVVCFRIPNEQDFYCIEYF
jgi:hypothetical protein